MDENICLPEGLDAHAVAEERFAVAYEAASERQRSLLKSFIAALWNACPPKRVRVERHESSWDQGGGTALLSRPLSWGMLCVDASVAAPSLVLSALLPAMTAGIREIAVIGLGSGVLTGPILTALELAGQEQVFELQAHEAKAMANSVVPTHAGLVMCLGREAQSVFADSQLPIWHPRPKSAGQDRPSRFSLGVFLEEKPQYSKQLKLDMDYLLPGVSIEWWSPSGKLGPTQAQLRAGDFACFGRGCFDAVLVPSSLSQQALENFQVVLDLGRAGYWLWPNLTEEHFRLRHAAML